MTDARPREVLDGNEAAARVAYRLSEVVAIYPITPSSPMAEHADDWASAGRPNLFGAVPEVVQMQSEAGAAGVLHGALVTGALATTFTASQGLLLMLPNMFKIAGELLPCVVHVAARTVATHALSIFGDHSDVMAARTTGFAMLCSSSVQEAQDLAAVAHAATLRSRVPFLHFFDGFRTSHELDRIETLSDDDLHAVVDVERVREHRARGLTPDRPTLRGSAQNPDVFFQAREAANGVYASVPGMVQAAMDELAERTGRGYGLFDYVGAPDAERVIVLMGSAAGAAGEAVEKLVAGGERVGLVVVRLYRPFDVAAFRAALPRTARRVAVLDRTKEPGAVGEPLFEDVAAALRSSLVDVVGGRYGLASKEFTPAMAAAVFAELRRREPRERFTVGITDDVSGLSLPVAPFSTEADDVVRAVFYALGSDGTVGANKNSAKIIGERAGLHAQAYFVYDSKKAGSVTVSHLRFGPRPIRSTYLIEQARFVACHQFVLLDRIDVLAQAAPGAIFLLNSPYPHEQVWAHLPREVRAAIRERSLQLHVVDASRIAREAGIPGRINVVLQTCFFALSGVLPIEEAIGAIKDAIRESYGKRGGEVVDRNCRAVDAALAGLRRVAVPATDAAEAPPRRRVNGEATDFVRRFTAPLLEGRGDELPVSAMPLDGVFPMGTARFEKRSLAEEIPIWDPAICIDCGKCAIVCPHAAIRMKVYDPADLEGAPDSFPRKPWMAKDLAGKLLTVQVAPDDCTGCGMCVEACPVASKTVAGHKAVDLLPAAEHRERERANFATFLRLPELDRSLAAVDTIKGSQLLQPLFEFSGACSGCGETPYLKLLTQLFGDRIYVANATGCSSIYGGNLPTTPWSANADGRGPAWANSLFEDDAEFGLGMRLAADGRAERARGLLRELRDEVGAELADAIVDAPQASEAEIIAARRAVAKLVERLATLADPRAAALREAADDLVRKSVWIVGGDGWAYDIGYGGLDHVLASGRDLNVLVLDTEVYSNTGGQSSKSTPRGAVAKFAARGKGDRRKDLGLAAMANGDVYVAQVSLGADNLQTVKALLEAESYPGPSLVIAYAHCIAHGIDMGKGLERQMAAARSGLVPLYRHDPRRAARGEPALHLDSKKPTLPFAEFAAAETRFSSLARIDPERAGRLMMEAQADIDERWRRLEELAARR